MHDSRVLDILRKRRDFISGEEISRLAGFGRQALWGHIRDLRDKGYVIESVPHLGYRLVSFPDRLYPEEIASNLGTRLVGSRIEYHDRISSTMDAARELAARGCQEGTIVVAETQTAGRGRLGRHWSSPKYKGIYFSCVLRPRMDAAQAPVLALVTAVAVCEAVERAAGVQARIKWPNDILLSHRKLGGILIELSSGAVVIGLGLNVNTGRDELVEGAVSLKQELKAAVSRAELLREVLRRLESRYSAFIRKGSGSALEEWRSRSVTLGSRVRIDGSRGHFEGEAVDIDADGGLMVRGESGIIHKFNAGDASHIR